MTKARLDELQAALVENNWEIKGDGKLGLYDVYNDQIIWNLFNENLWKKKQLVFYLFDDFGKRTISLADISYVNTNNERLYFNKICSSEWANDLKLFVTKISKSS